MTKLITRLGLSCFLLLAFGASRLFAYEITVTRGKGTEGTITCTDAGVSNVKCYWNAEKRIPAGTYTNCSTTIMETKKYKSVFIPDVPGFSGIFIHQGSGPKDSDGCIVTATGNVQKIYEKIPRDLKNITVNIIDQ
jgi:hypothetical protein